VDRNLAMELVRVTEAAALASARFMGRGDEAAADMAAIEAMKKAFGVIAIDGTVVIGEGAEDAMPMLYVGEKVGTGHGPATDVEDGPKGFGAHSDQERLLPRLDEGRRSCSRFQLSGRDRRRAHGRHRDHRGRDRRRDAADAPRARAAARPSPARSAPRAGRGCRSRAWRRA